ncbi:MAG: response regulator transcription factor [Clostridia bacterium]|nr:response regulator transcription factor [Clostridia bacterium]
MVKIAIADDQVLFRDMLSIILTQDHTFEVIGSAGDGNEILQLCDEEKPDIVLLDVNMPVADGIFALLKIKEKYPHMKVIMLTTFEEEDYILNACTNAADGYLLKDTKPETLINTIKCVNDGLFVMHRSVQQCMVKQLAKALQTEKITEIADERFDFDPIDLKILKLLSLGKSNAEIAQSLNYSEGTIKNRISRMLDITELKDRTQLAIFALQNGII